VLRKFAVSKLLLGIGLGLTLAPNAGAWSLSLVQVDGTYDGVQAHPGDTLVLSIEYDLGDSSVSLVAPTITWGPEVASFDGGTETGAANWGGVILDNIQTGDIDLLNPNVATGWEKGNLSGGATSPCFSGACTTLGTASFTLSGLGGVIDFGPGQLVVEEPVCMVEPWLCGTLNAFTVIPEPATASLLGLGLLGMALLSRQRKR
jgi:hypothetical protein